MTRERDRCTKVVHMSNDEKRKYAIRLNRIEGSIRGINKMIYENMYG